MILKNYQIKSLNHKEYYDWLLTKHYAKRICSVSYCFGLVCGDFIEGVITFGSPPNYTYNDGACLYKNYKCKTLELNRLVINEYNVKNLLSYFVANSIKKLPKPLTLVSYADPNYNHHGYIYQATNWIFTGESNPRKKYIYSDGSTHNVRRHHENRGELISTEKIKPTLRYIYLHGDKKQKKEMKKHLSVKNLPYPKGQNKKYKCHDIKMNYNKTFMDILEVNDIKKCQAG